MQTSDLQAAVAALKPLYHAIVMAENPDARTDAESAIVAAYYAAKNELDNRQQAEREAAELALVEIPLGATVTVHDTDMHGRMYSQPGTVASYRIVQGAYGPEAIYEVRHSKARGFGYYPAAALSR
jgi:hypothetical protein